MPLPDDLHGLFGENECARRDQRFSFMICGYGAHPLFDGRYQ